MSKNRKPRNQSSFLTNAEVQQLGLSPKQVRQADSAHAELLASLADRRIGEYKGSNKPSRAEVRARKSWKGK